MPLKIITFSHETTLRVRHQCLKEIAPSFVCEVGDWVYLVDHPMTAPDLIDELDRVMQGDDCKASVFGLSYDMSLGADIESPARTEIVKRSLNEKWAKERGA